MQEQFHPARPWHYLEVLEELHHGIPVVHGKKFDSGDGEGSGELQYCTGTLQRIGLPAMG